MSSAAQAIDFQDATKDRRIQDWIVRNIGGTIERFEAQSRWRGGWWIDVRKDGKLLNLYVREDRNEAYPPWPLEHEAGALMVLEKHGVPVPHIYGIIDDPHATVMDCIPGDFDFSNVSEAERVSILEDFAEAVARQHAIPPQELANLGIIKMPETPEEIPLGCFKICEDMYLKRKNRPEPMIEFFRQWVYRNIPRHRNKVSILAVDSGQFLFKDGKVSGLYDFEYACLGDPMIDIAFIPLRLSMYNAGDTGPFMKRYAELTGEAYELDVLAFHAVWWALCTPLIIAADFHEPSADTKYFEMAGWFISMILTMTEVLGDAKGLNLSQDIEAAPPQPSRWAKLFDVMAAKVPPPASEEPYVVTEQRKGLEFARRMDAHPELEADYLREVERLTGRKVNGWLEADTVLEEFVLSAGPEHDDELIRLFHRWAVLQSKVLLADLIPLPMLETRWPRLSRLIG